MRHVCSAQTAHIHEHGVMRKADMLRGMPTPKPHEINALQRRIKQRGSLLLELDAELRQLYRGPRDRDCNHRIYWLNKAIFSELEAQQHELSSLQEMLHAFDKSLSHSTTTDEEEAQAPSCPEPRKDWHTICPLCRAGKQGDAA